LLVEFAVSRNRLENVASINGIHNLYLSLRGSLGREVSRIVPPKDIEDIVQETYVRVCQFEKKGKIREPRSFLYKTARNLAFDHVKRADSRLVISAEEINESEFREPGRSFDETFDRVASDKDFSQFCDAVRHLPVQCRRAFVLKKVYGCSQREIAREMKISESTVEKHIAQGIKRCTYFMMKHGDEHRGGGNTNHQTGSQPTSTPRMKGRS
jgi:RNA polymerase sigma-70 factor (ECF subfamily)